MTVPVWQAENRSGDLKTKSYAGFGQLDYELVDKLKLTLGLRYSSDTKRGAESYRVVQWQPAGASVYCTTAPGAAFFSTSPRSRKLN